MKRVLERLLDHVPDPARGRRHEQSQWQWLNEIARKLVSDEGVTHLGPVAVDQRDLPTFASKCNHGAE